MQLRLRKGTDHAALWPSWERCQPILDFIFGRYLRVSPLSDTRL